MSSLSETTAVVNLSDHKKIRTMKRQPGYEQSNEREYLTVAQHEQRIQAETEGKRGRFRILARAIFSSLAFRALKLEPREVLLCYLNKIDYEKRKKGGQQKHSGSPCNANRVWVTNNEIKARGGIKSDTTIKKARAELVNIGFLDFVQYGGAGLGSDIYALSERWRQYPHGDYHPAKVKQARFGQKSNIVDNLARQGRRARWDSPAIS